MAEQRAQLEEQRRLFFVGMTRTTDILVFSSYSQLPTNIAQNLRVRRGAFIPGANAYRVFASPFLEETGQLCPRLFVASTGSHEAECSPVLSR